MKPRIALQLYTIRDQLAEDFDSAIQRVADIGYDAVETAFFPDSITPKEAARRFRDVGLTVVAAHCSLPLGEFKGPTLALLDDLQCARAIWHGWPRDVRFGSRRGIEELADAYNAAHEVARAAGIRSGLHNHWWEFEPVDGCLPYETLRSILHPDIFFELDAYWIQTAGRDPAAVIAEAGDRAPLLHIKDGPAIHAHPMVAVGTGALDMPAIVQASRNHAECLIVELDTCAGDIWQAIKQSHQYLSKAIQVLYA